MGKARRAAWREEQLQACSQPSCWPTTSTGHTRRLGLHALTIPSCRQHAHGLHLRTAHLLPGVIYRQGERGLGAPHGAHVAGCVPLVRAVGGAWMMLSTMQRIIAPLTVHTARCHPSSCVLSPHAAQPPLPACPSLTTLLPHASPLPSTPGARGGPGGRDLQRQPGIRRTRGAGGPCGV